MWSHYTLLGTFLFFLLGILDIILHQHSNIFFTILWLYGMALGGFIMVDVTSPLLRDIWVVQSFTNSEAPGHTHHFSQV